MPPPITYPAAHKEDIVDDFHGTPVADPYRWLEEADSPATRAWVNAQNELTRRLLDPLPVRARLEERLTALWDFPRYEPPRRRGAYLFFLKNDGLQNQPALYCQTDHNAEPRLLLDPNTLSEDGTIALTAYHPNDDGSLIACLFASGGSDWQEIQILDVASGALRDDHLTWVKFTSVAWKPDNSGFFYSRYPEPGSIPDAPPSTHHRVHFHTLGTPQTNDVLIYARPDAPDLGFEPHISDDDRYLLLHVWQGTAVENRFYIRPLDGEEPFTLLLDEADARYQYVGNDGTRFYFHTDWQAPHGRVIAIDLDHPAREAWQEIVPAGSATIDAVRLVADHFVVVLIEDATHQVRLFRRDGTPAGVLSLPAAGNIEVLSGRRNHDAFFFDFQSFLYPPTVFRVDLPGADLTTWYQPQLPFDAATYVTQQVFYTSRDGTRVPMFLTHRRDLALDGDNPTVLYGYGGFAVNMTPAFSVSWLVWLEQGGILAWTSLRGGNEYGEAWHRAGMLGNKQNVFDDFIAAAEWLVSNGYTNSSRLAAIGGSNGGLLVTASLLQRPDLFGAVVARVPVTDMLRYHRFTAGRYWIPEYGNAEENAEHFRFLYAYSPLHNVQPGTAYPPTLITSADTDDRVVPMHAKKLAATLQAATAGPDPILLRVETRAGHGLGKPTRKVIDELADTFAFLHHYLRMSG